jgi:phosphonate transport system permease protein
VVGADERHGLGAWLRRGFLEVCRLALDVLRGIPDFTWAILIANFTGANAVTGTLAIAVSVAGVLGKVLSEQWDNVPPERYAALRSTGAGRLQIFFYGIQPAAARAMFSFVLMRTECAVRNSSVIGVVGGGGLGTQLWDEFTNLDSDARYPRMVTVLLSMLVLTAAADVVANLFRRHLRVDPNHPRAARDSSAAASTRKRLVGCSTVLVLLGGCVFWLREPFALVVEKLGHAEWPFVRDYTVGLLVPELSGEALRAAASASLTPLALGLLATLAATLAAGFLSFPASAAFLLAPERFTGERPTAARRALRWSCVLATRAFGLLLRGIPEVAWVLILMTFFRQGITPCVLAVALHSTGVLLRVFTETLDNVPYRRLEQVSGACRPQIFLYGGLPTVWPDWKTYAFFQFEVNVRIGVLLGTVGAGGLGDKFESNLQLREFARASTFLWAMVGLTVCIDRLSRFLLLRRLKC